MASYPPLLTVSSSSTRVSLTPTLSLASVPPFTLHTVPNGTSSSLPASSPAPLFASSSKTLHALTYPGRIDLLTHPALSALTSRPVPVGVRGVAGDGRMCVYGLSMVAVIVFGADMSIKSSNESEVPGVEFAEFAGEQLVYSSRGEVGTLGGWRRAYSRPPACEPCVEGGR